MKRVKIAILALLGLYSALTQGMERPSRPPSWWRSEVTRKARQDYFAGQGQNSTPQDERGATQNNSPTDTSTSSTSSDLSQVTDAKEKHRLAKIEKDIRKINETLAELGVDLLPIAITATTGAVSGSTAATVASQAIISSPMVVFKLGKITYRLGNIIKHLAFLSAGSPEAKRARDEILPTLAALRRGLAKAPGIAIKPISKLIEKIQRLLDKDTPEGR